MQHLCLFGQLRRISPSPLAQVRFLTLSTVGKRKAITPTAQAPQNVRLYSDKKGLVSHEGSDVSTNVKEIVKETTKTVSYSVVILAGVSVTAMLFYVIFKELFSSKSPNNVYAKAFDRCTRETKVLDALGEPIKGFGEENRRGRRRHVSHTLYEVNGVVHMRMRFYLKGSRKSATAHLEVKENENGDYEYRYLFIQLDDYPRTVIVIEDNRHDNSKVLTPSPEIML
ncbi:mitochondrial import inner membrane translocase subunit Tim21 [Cimex lectularius]|uniref:Mitochondrial import inner membrane translocase subunit Tim21 n=1 Tax=Cimex lectularius TaxID=79782 RepID=A0A8I6TFA4_CIMLE|nr:mitochondrial import inner membrane translocase subunit Tim21 [Cimex lectularius]